MRPICPSGRHAALVLPAMAKLIICNITLFLFLDLTDFFDITTHPDYKKQRAQKAEKYRQSHYWQGFKKQ